MSKKLIKCIGKYSLFFVWYWNIELINFFRYFNLKATIQVFFNCVVSLNMFLPFYQKLDAAILLYDLFAFHVLVSLVYQDFEESIYSWLLRISFIVLLQLCWPSNKLESQTRCELMVLTQHLFTNSLNQAKVVFSVQASNGISPSFWLIRK